MSETRKVIVLLGMHRSGTSLAMSMLASLGVPCGEDLIPAARSNEAGFWEHAGIVRQHERLLSRMGRVWHGPRGTHPFPQDWLDSDDALEAEEQLTAILEKELSAANDVWGFKDPRTARLLPLWQRIFRRLDVTPTYILSTRHPAAVTRSLQKHNGMDAARGELVWLLHNLDALRHAGDHLALVVDYDLIVADPLANARRLTSALPPSLNITDEEIAAAATRVSPAMRRNSSSDDAVLNPLVKDTYRNLLQLAQDRSPDERLQWLTENASAMQELFRPWIIDTKSPLVDWSIRAMLRGKYR